MNTLIHYPLCPFSRSIRILLAELKVPFALVEEKPWEWRPEFLAINPSGDLPVLQLTDGGTVPGCYAIAEYLGDVVRASPPDEREFDPFPGTIEARAEVRRLSDWFQHKLDREVTRELLREKAYPRLRKDAAAQPPDPHLLRAIRANLRYHLSYISYLADQRRWLAGDALTFADMAAAAQLSVFDYLDEVAWETSPVARDWYMRMKSRPSFRPLLADRLPGITPPDHYADLDF